MPTQKEGSLKCFAERFLEAADIAAVFLPKRSGKDNCEYAVHPELNSPWNVLYFLREQEDWVRISYNRVVAASPAELVERADVQRVIGTIVRNKEYFIEYINDYDKNAMGFCIQAEVKEDRYKKFAEVLGTIDRMVRLYLDE